MEPGLWLLSAGTDAPGVAVHYNPPVLVLRVKVLDLGPGNRKAELYRHLLELNATDLVHGSYGTLGILTRIELELIPAALAREVTAQLTMPTGVWYSTVCRPPSRRTFTSTSFGST